MILARAAEELRAHDDNDPAPLRPSLERLYEALGGLGAASEDEA